MGFMQKMKDKQAAHIEAHKFDANVGGCYLMGRQIKGPEPRDRFDVAGAVASVEQGVSRKGVTATRVMLTGVLAPAIKKDKTKVYVLIEWPDGAVHEVEASAKDEAQARRFARQVTAAGAHYSQE